MKEYLEGLNSLRAVGVLMIVLFHLTYQTTFPNYLSFIHNYFALGVQLFLLISAFSIYYGYFDQLTTKKELKSYFVRRFLRIAPLFYLILVITLIGSYIVGVRYSIDTILLNLTFLFNLSPTIYDSLVGAGWTIGVLYIFYLLVPILITFIRRIWTAFILLIGLLIFSSCYHLYLSSLLGFSWDFSYKSIVTQLPFFIMGILCFLLLRDVFGKPNRNPKPSIIQRALDKILKKRYEKNIRELHNKIIEKCISNIVRLFVKRIKNIIGLGLIIFAILLASMLMWPSPIYLILAKIPYIYARYYAWGLVFFCLLTGFLLYPCRLYVNRFTKFIGDRSYSIYLIHGPTLFMLIPIYTAIYGWISNLELALLLSLLLTLSLVLIFSSLAYKYIEQPAMKYGTLIFLRKKKI